MVDLVGAIANGTDPRPSFEDGLHVQRVLDAAERSNAADGERINLPATTEDDPSTNADQTSATTGR